MLTDRIAQALALAVEAHQGQKRKGTDIPYIAHPLGVASIALEHGADEELTMAALLHDAAEDGGPEYAQRIRQQFGDRFSSQFPFTQESSVLHTIIASNLKLRAGHRRISASSTQKWSQYV